MKHYDCKGTLCLKFITTKLPHSTVTRQMWTKGAKIEKKKCKGRYPADPVELNWSISYMDSIPLPLQHTVS